MAGFGGAVKLTGESEYRKALSQINQSLKETSAEMRAVASAYATGDKSQQATSAKTEVLNRKLTEQEQKLKTLRAQYASMASQYSQQTAKHTALVNEYNQEKLKLDQIGKTLGTTSKEYQEQKGKVEALAQEVSKSAKAQDANGKSMSKMRIEIHNAQADCNNTSRELDMLGETAKSSGKSAEKAGDGFTVFKAVIANLATQAITMAIDGIKKLGSTVVDVGKQAIDSYGNYEQLEGGVKKLFGDDVAKSVVENANNAFNTAGMSANEYMETVTNFSASLISGLNGDTEKASKLADQAIRDMSDNANTFGTDISSIQYAYQGFAKGNFTMLDNLKLGYGGTKEEMLRLVKDAGVVEDSVKSIDDVSFDQIIEAITITQERMHITGTTADEASRTIQGSVGSMKSAWQNLLTGMADENANFEQLASNFVSTLITPDGKGGVLGNIIPRITQVISGMSSAIQTMLPMLIKTVVPLIQSNLPLIMTAVQDAIKAVLDVLPEIIPVISELIPQIIGTLLSLLPDIINAGIQIILGLIDGLTEALPQLIEMLPSIITEIVQVLQANLPQIIQTGIKVLTALIDGLAKAIPTLISYVPKIIVTIVNVLVQNLPQILQTGVRAIMSLISGLGQALPTLIGYVPKIISSMASTLISNLPKILNAGIRAITSFVSGITQSLGRVASGAGQIVSTVVSAVSSLPSKMWSVGSNLVQGIWEGISGSLGWIRGKISGWVGNVTSFIKGLFGIHSPSTLFRDEIGKNLALGIGEGFTQEMGAVTSAMQDAMPTSFDLDTSVKRRSSDGITQSVDMISAFKEALSQMKIVLDDEVAGEFVERTVTRVIYT